MTICLSEKFNLDLPVIWWVLGFSNCLTNTLVFMHSAVLGPSCFVCLFFLLLNKSFHYLRHSEEFTSQSPESRVHSSDPSCWLRPHLHTHEEKWAQEVYVSPPLARRCGSAATKHTSERGVIHRGAVLAWGGFNLHRPRQIPCQSRKKKKLYGPKWIKIVCRQGRPYFLLGKESVGVGGSHLHLSLSTYQLAVSARTSESLLAGGLSWLLPPCHILLITAFFFSPF